MRYLSLFSGIEAASVAWLPLGWECAAVAEIEPFPCAVLSHHYPEVPNLGDVTRITEADIKAIGDVDIVVGGFPCQDLSVAGKRKGLMNEDGIVTRSGLFFQAMRIVRWSGARFVLLENVPGIYSSNAGRDFAAVVGEVLGVEFAVPAVGWQNAGVAASERGLFEWATLDAQYFGVAQRRRRMFALGDFGDWANRPPVLFERHSLSGHPAPSREAGKGVTHSTAPCLTSSGRGVERAGDTRGQDPVVAVAFGGNNQSGPINVATARNACASASGRMDFESETFLVQPHPVAYATKLHNTQSNQAGKFYENYTASLDANSPPPDIVFDTTQITSKANYSNPKAGDPCHPLAAQAHVPCIAFPERMSGTQCAATENLAPSMGALNPTAIAFQERGRAGGPNLEIGGDLAFALTAPNGGGRAQERNVLAPAMQVRRLTPVECARLQGFPDHYLDIAYRGKPAADGPKYKALGNSMAVPVMRWIGERIQSVSEIRVAEAAR